jgi:hypothetical protein
MYTTSNITTSTILALPELGEVSQNTRNIVYIACINNLLILEQVK